MTKLKWMGAIVALCAATWVGVASATERTYPCEKKGESHKHHKRHQHDSPKPCDCDGIWKAINEIIVRVTKIEEEAKPGPVGPAGPPGPSGPMGPAGKVVVLTPVFEWPASPLRPGCAYVNRGPGRRVGSTWRIRIGVVCVSSTGPAVAG